LFSNSLKEGKVVYFNQFHDSEYNWHIKTNYESGCFSRYSSTVSTENIHNVDSEKETVSSVEKDIRSHIYWTAPIWRLQERIDRINIDDSELVPNALGSKYVDAQYGQKIKPKSSIFDDPLGLGVLNGWISI
jgi:hypothetical protein